MSTFKIEAIFSLINRASAPMKAVTKDITKVGTAGEFATKALKKVNDISAKVANGIGKVSRAALWSSAALFTAGSALIGLGVSYVKNQAQQAIAMLRSAQSAGIAASAYQELRYVFESNGQEVQNLDDALEELNKNSQAAISGSKSQASAFKSIGVSVKGANGQLRAADAVFADIAAKFQKMPDGAKKSALAMQLFGERGAELIPILNQGADGIRKLRDEARALGIVLDDKTLKAAAALDAKFKKLKNSIFGLQSGIWGKLIPSVTKLVDWFQNIITINRQDILAAINRSIDWLIVNLPSIIRGIQIFWAGLMKIYRTAAGISKAMGGMNGIIDAFVVLVTVRAAAGMAMFAASIWGVNAALFGCPIVWIIAGVTALAVAAYLIIRNWDKVSKWMTEFWAKWGGWITPVLGLFSPIVAFAATIMSAWKPVGDFFAGLWSKISQIGNKGPIVVSTNAAPQAPAAGGAPRATPPGGGGQSFSGHIVVEGRNGTQIKSVSTNNRNIGLTGKHGIQGAGR